MPSAEQDREEPREGAASAPKLQRRSHLRQICHAGSRVAAARSTEHAPATRSCNIRCGDGGGRERDKRHHGFGNGEHFFQEEFSNSQASLTAHWHDKGADWRGLAHTPARRILKYKAFITAHWHDKFAPSARDWRTGGTNAVVRGSFLSFFAMEATSS